MAHSNGGDDDNNPITPDPESQGGPEAGSYQQDPDMPIPGESGVDKSHQ